MAKIKRSPHAFFFQVVLALCLLFVILIILYPLYYMFIVSISDRTAVLSGAVRYLPGNITFKVYTTLFQDSYFLRTFWNTLVITVAGTSINMVMTTICAYPLARRDFYGGRFFTAIITFTMFFSGGMVPAYLLVNQLGLLNTYWAIILPGSINVYNMIVMRTFFQGLPHEIAEAAHVDGANDLRIFFQFVLPLSKPILATMVLFYAVGHWNGYVSAVLYLMEKNLYPIQLYVRSIVLSGDTTALSMNMAAGAEAVAFSEKSMQYGVVIAAALPILLIYPFVSRFFEKGVMIGSVKG